MLKSFSNHYLTPDDFSVPCRLRHCEESSSCDGDEDQTQRKEQLNRQPEEMTCTMRKWHRETNTSSKFMSPHRRNSAESQTKVDDAELLLTPVNCFHRRRCCSGELSKVTDTNKPIPLSKRFASFGTPEFIDNESRNQCQNSSSDTQEQGAETQQKFLEEITIPVNDIIRVVTRGEDDSKKKKGAKKRSSSTDGEVCQQPTIIVTTSCSGSYELLMESTNEQLVVMTFLKANSRKGCVSFATEDEQRNDARYNHRSKEKNSKDTITNRFEMNATNQKVSNDKNSTGAYQDMVIESNPSNVTQGTAQSNGERSIDVEAFTAKGMNERLKTESLTEKLERRMHRFISSLDELASSFTNCACGCLGDTTDNAITIEKGINSRSRRNTASTVSSSDNIENDPAMSVEDSSTTIQPTSGSRVELLTPQPKKPSRDELMAHAQLPSGLSVESESIFEEKKEEIYDVPVIRPIRVAPAIMASDI